MELGFASRTLNIVEQDGSTAGPEKAAAQHSTGPLQAQMLTCHSGSRAGEPIVTDLDNKRWWGDVGDKEKQGPRRQVA